MNDKKYKQKISEAKKQKEASDKRLLNAEFVIGLLSIFVLYAVVFAEVYFIDTNVWPSWLRIVTVIVGIVIFIVAMCFCLRIEQTAGYYECQKCGNRYIPKYSSVFLSMHINRIRYMKCPKCNKYSWQRKVITNDTDPSQNN